MTYCEAYTSQNDVGSYAGPGLKYTYNLSAREAIAYHDRLQSLDAGNPHPNSTIGGLGSLQGCASVLQTPGFPSSKLFGLPTNSLPNPCPRLARDLPQAGCCRESARELGSKCAIGEPGNWKASYRFQGYLVSPSNRPKMQKPA